jgi:Domain of unknown function (DUF3883)/Protein of unknown function (DUF3684)
MPTTKLPRRWKHLKMIRSTLANLRGGGSLANELIQNADDADGARRLVFRFTDDYLEVSDDGGFRACPRPNDPDDCPWELAGGRACDFHAFRELGGASKADDPSLTGAFGIGFLAVYQVTDHPELFSRGIHWILDEADESVTVCEGCGETHITAGTTFKLPWAKRRTRLREALGAETISAEGRRRLLRQFIEQVPHAMIFLRKLDEIEIAGESSSIARFSRSPEGDTVRITGPGGEDEWLVLEGNFNAQADALRQRHPLIGSRHAQVRIALRPGQKISGRLYATLPTTIPTGLPLHLDASFFPRLDRKGILLDSGYEADWNRAAITGAAELLTAHLERVAVALGPKPFWSLVADARTLQRRDSGEAQAVDVFWAQLLKALPSASVMWTRSGKWARVSEVVVPPRDPALADLLEDLGIPAVSPLIQPLVPNRALGIKGVTLEQLVNGVEALGLIEGAPIGKLPAALQPRPRRNALRKELGTLVAAREELESGLEDRLRRLVLWEGSDGRFSSFGANWLVSRDTVRPLARFSPHAFVVWPERDAASKALTRIGDVYTIDQALSHLEDASEELAKLTVGEARAILGWFQSRLDELTDIQVERLTGLPLMPTERGLRPASETVRAGGFRDPLRLTSVLDQGAVAGLDGLIAKLKIRKLGFAAYLREHVAALEQLDQVPAAALVELIRHCATHRDAIDAEPALIKLLAELPWIPCRDGLRRPPGETYFSSALVHDVLGASPPLVHPAIKPRTAAGDLLRLLGASEIPRPADVVAHVNEIVAALPTDRRVAQVVAILRYLSERAGDLDRAVFAPLRTLAWLPAEGENQWRAPGQLHLAFSRALFATTGRFIALRRTDQERLRTTLTALGVRSSPSIQLVVDHVVKLAAQGQAATSEPLRWLNDRASDPQIQRLAACAFLPTADGRLERPGRVFRHRHRLVPWRAVLRPGLDRLVDLLDALGVGRDPDAHAAADVLLEISDTVDERRELDSSTLAVVTRCWEMLIAATDAELDRLGGHDVVPAADGRLYPADAVLLEDVPGAGRWLSAAALSRLVALDGRQQALERAGVGRLSQHRRGEVLASTEPINGHWIEGRLQERRIQLARIVTAEGGDWRSVITLIQDVTVAAVGALTVRYRLEGLAGLPENPAVDTGAFYARENSQLFVRVADGRPDWQALAHVVRDEILPGFGPGTSLAIKAALAAQSCSDADADLADYPALPDGVCAEFEQIARDRSQAAEFPGGADASDDDYGEYDGDGDADDEDDAGDADTQDNDAGADDEHDDDEARQRRPRARTGTGRNRTQAGRGTETGGAASGRSHEEPNGSAAVPKKRDPSGKTDGPSADYQLISYVVPNGHSPSHSDSGSHEQRLRDAAGEAGVDLVIEHLETELRGSGARIEKMPAKNKGYDILVRDANGEPHRYIEVKATAGAWGLRGVGLTEPQFSLAREERERYWLYVVEHLYQAEARLWWIRDPAGRVTYFHYDHGWQSAAEGHATVTGARSPVRS